MGERSTHSAAIFFEVWGLMILAVLAAFWIDNLIFRLVLSFFIAALFSRMFNVYHDTCHRAMLRDQPLKRRMMIVYGYLVLTPPRVWHPEHTAHHRETGVYDEPVPGEFPLWSRQRYESATRLQRLNYRFQRHPAVMIAGYATAFLFTWSIAPFFSNPHRYWRNGLALASHLGFTGILIGLGGVEFALLAFNLPIAIASAAGVYFFYVQHNAPGLHYTAKPARDAASAAVFATTFFRMPGFMNWATGNIGYHHIHHFSSKIPFYRLPEANAALPELKGHVKETSWRPRDIIAAFRANLVDATSGAMVSFQSASPRRVRVSSLQ